MALRLRVVSDHRRSLGDRCNIVFGVGGGTIGRSADNDWVLPDPLRYVSAHHARVSFRQGAYFLEDLSTNGVYVNDDEQPLGQAGPAQARRTATCSASATTRSSWCSRRRPRGSRSRPPRVHRPTPRRPHQHHRACAPSAARPDGHRRRARPRRPARARAGRQVAAEPRATWPRAAASARERLRPGRGARAAPGRDRAAEPDRTSRTRKSSPGASRAWRRPPAARPAQRRQRARALRRAERPAGLLPWRRHRRRTPAGRRADPHACTSSGSCSARRFVGLKDLERSRNEIRNRFRIEMPADADDPRPSLTRMTVEELLLELLHQHETRRARCRAVAARGDEHGEGSRERHRARHARCVRGVRRAGSTRPSSRRASSAPRAAASCARRQARKYWELYAEFYRNLVEKPAEHLPHTFVEAFSLAYREFLQTPAGLKPRHQAPGSISTRVSPGNGLGRPPLEQREKTLHAVHELHGLPAARIAALGLRVPALLREQGQVLAHVRPRIRVLAAGLREHARIFEMPEAHVVRGHGEPGAIRLRNARRNLLAHLGEILRAGEDALLGVRAIRDSPFPAAVSAVSIITPSAPSPDSAFGFHLDSW